MRPIVITTINTPTKAIEDFSLIQGMQTIVIGDAKTPPHWCLPNCTFISLNSPHSNEFHLSSLVPKNSYTRKMLGYLYAIKAGAKFIYETDDDNSPLQGFDPGYVAEHIDQYERSFVTGPKGFVNVYELFTSHRVWPRGFPLEDLTKEIVVEFGTSAEREIGVLQGLADNDPDVDAIYRMTKGETFDFQQREMIILGKEVLTPFNSQNTFFFRSYFPLMYLPITVTFRFTDILRSYVAQNILWNADAHIAYMSSTVVQNRNQHNLLADFESEIPMYLNANKICKTLGDIIEKNACICENMILAYRKLLEIGVVETGELVALKAWLRDASTCHEN